MEPTYFNVSIWVQVHQEGTQMGGCGPFQSSMVHFENILCIRLVWWWILLNSLFSNGPNDVCVHSHDEWIDNSLKKGSIILSKELSF